MRRHIIAIVASVVVLSAAVGVRASMPSTNPGPQKTTLDAIYTKAQADGAKAQFDKICAECHAFTVAAKKQAADLPLGDEPFFKKWEGKTIDELVSVIVLTMPNDGSAIVSEAEALNLMAYVLQQNGFPAGATPLTKEASAAVLARPKK
jgi:mono/diheme cytochrome c family protein